jgi:TonB-linked SusC/RagA family outer membrane protein
MKKQRFVGLTAIVMRMVLIQCFLTFFLTSFAYEHYADAQGILDKAVTLSIDKGQLKEVFTTLKNQTGARFVFSSKTIEADQKVSIKATNKKLSEVLQELLTPFGINYKIVKDRIVLYKPKSFSYEVIAPAINNELPVNIEKADKEIKGQITDDKGASLAGVSIVVKGTGKGVNTDLNGAFTISVPEDKSVLVITYIGYQQQEVDITGKTSVSIAMVAVAGQLSDVVVVGYGTQKKITVTGSVATVKGAELEKSPSVNLSNSLAGRMPGVIAVQASGEPGYDGSAIHIRGSNTLGNNNALIVIDGIPERTGGLDRLNPADIENMSILKDASAAIYGSRAANGVILITTKRGKSGQPKLSYDFNQGWAQATRIPKMSDAPQYAEMNNELVLFNKIPTNQWAAAWAAFKNTGTYTRTDNNEVVNAPYQPAAIEQYRDGSDIWAYPNTDWFGTALKEWSPQVRHNLQLSGGSENIKFLASLGYNNQDAYYKNSATGYKQYDIRINLDARINKYVNTSLGIIGREEYRFYPTQSAGAIFRMLMRGKPTEHEVWPNGLPGPDIENGQNPIVITTNQTGYDRDKRDFIQTNGRVEITNPWISGLKLTLSGSVDKYIYRGKRWETPWYLYFWDRVSYEPDGVTPVLTKNVRSTFTDPRLTQRDESQLNINLTGLLNYDRIVGDHTFNLLAGITRETVSSDNFNAFRRYFISPAVDQLSAGSSAEQNTGGSAYERARLSYFGRVAYNYQEKYLAEFVWRYDGSYIFPKEKRFGFFPGVLMGWNISNENFLKNSNTISFLKLRASYGQMGNDQVFYNGLLQEYAYLSTYSFGTYIINDQVQKTLYEPRVANPDFTWEVANNADIGLEGSLLNSRLSFEFDYFYNKRTKILIQKQGSTPASSGISDLLPPVNLGRVDNKGWEFKVGYSDRLGDLKYSVSVNGGYAKNKVVFFDEASGAPAYQLRTGKPIGTYLAYEYDGVFMDQKDIDANQLDYTALTGTLKPGDMKFRDVNGDKKINGDDQVRLDKSRDPMFSGGISLSLQYKDFDFSALFQGATGGLLFIGTESGDIGNYLEYSYNNRWTVEKPSSVDPRLANRGDTYYTGGGAGSNTYWLRNSDYLRLKNIELAYNLPGEIGKKAGISSLRIYVNALNLVTWDKMKIWDPESTSGNGQYYPQSRIINTGVRVTF